MAEKFKKIEKEFLLTDSSVNSYGFRLLTSGYLMGEFQKNPIGYYMHERDKGVLVKWDNLRMEGDQVFGKPCINLSNPRGQQTVDEIESGFLNAASFGHFVVLDASDTDKLPDQTGPTVTKWYNRECSLVDIPGNFNSLKLFDKDDNEIALADFPYKILNMKVITLTAEQLGKLNLKADVADPAAVDVALNNLVAESAKVPVLIQDLAAANTAKKDAEDALAALKADTVTKEVDGILSNALNVDKKITKEMSDQLKAVYATNPTGLKALIAAMPAHVSIAAELNKKDQANNQLAAKSWSELDKEGKLEDLKAADIVTFKAKYKEAFGTEYNG
jgi:hypothetical protein